MALKYIVAGLTPTGTWPDRIEILLMNAVKAKWTTDILDPPVAYVNFNDTWFDNGYDITYTFKFLRERPMMRSVGWNRKNTASFIDVHMWIRAKSLGLTDANYQYKCMSAFHDLIELNPDTILPPAEITVDDIHLLTETEDYLQDVLHYKFDLTLWYEKVKVNV